MKQNIMAATILAFGLVLATLVLSGRYSFQRLGNQRIARLDRWFGSVQIYCLDDLDWSAVCSNRTLQQRAAERNSMMNMPEYITTTDMNVVQGSNTERHATSHRNSTTNVDGTLTTTDATQNSD